MPWLWILACAPYEGPPPCEAEETGLISLPTDEGAHETPDEEWSWVGHVEDVDGAWYGYTLRYQVSRSDTQESLSLTATITDVDGQTFDALTDSEAFSSSIGADSFSFAFGETTATGGTGTDTLDFSVGPHSLSLSLTETKPAAIHHGDGLLSLDVGSELTAYSRTRLLTTGTLAGPEGNPRALTGTGWFDHHWGDLSALDAAGFQTFSLTLDNGFEYQLLQVGNPTPSEVVAGTWIDPGCGAVEFSPEAARITSVPDTEWVSPETGCTYPTTWTIQILDEVYGVDASLDAQEVLLPDGSATWQGLATITGPVGGRATVRRQGYCD